MKIIWSQKWWYFPVAKTKGGNVFQMECFYVCDYISAYKSQMAFMGLDFEDDKPRMNAELTVMMAELN